MDWPEIYSRLRADRNDTVAWGELEWRVRRWARMTLGEHGPDLVEDAVADACTRVVLDLADARGAETFAGFTRGKFLNARKAAVAWLRQPVVRLDVDAELPAPSTDTEGDQHATLYAVLDHCLELLPHRDRRAVQLRYYEDAHAERIARELRVTEGNARRIVFNGLNRLRKCARGYGVPAAGAESFARA